MFCYYQFVYLLSVFVCCFIYLFISSFLSFFLYCLLFKIDFKYEYTSHVLDVVSMLQNDMGMSHIPSTLSEQVTREEQVGVAQEPGLRSPPG